MRSKINRNTSPRDNTQNNLPSNLSDGDYTARTTKLTVPNDRPLDFTYLKTGAQNTLKIMLAQTMGEVNLDDLEKKISELERTIEREKKSLGSAKTISTLENNLIILKDLNKVVGLTSIIIPNSSPTTNFYTLRDSAGGVTEKLSLISEKEVIKQLQNLFDKRDELDTDTYLKSREHFKLNTGGILKLPKHGKTTEVQREAIALNISRILGFPTTQSTMVEHGGKAALFIPFDKIQLLNEFADGEVQHVIVPSSLKGISKIGDEYLHYSTIVPVGNRLNPDQMIEDFGHVMAFSYLCNDTDFIGMNNQNKAIQNGNQLYIFDQVVMSKEKMSFDTRLSLIPTGLERHSRHNQGRNRSLIEDSAFESKFNSITHLLNNKDKVNEMLNSLIMNHEVKITQITQAIEKINLKNKSIFSRTPPELIPLKQQLKEIEILKDDAISVKKTINQRMETLFDNFPILNGKKIDSEQFLKNSLALKSCLTLEKLVNKPVLFSDDGRPYRNPWTYRNTNKIDSINIVDGNAHISFANINPMQMFNILNNAGINPTLYKQENNTLIIPVIELSKITEKCLLPELSPFDMRTNYLDPEHLKGSLSGYEDDANVLDTLLPRIMQYQIDLFKARNQPKLVVNLMNTMLEDLSSLPPGTNKGMIKQAELNLQLDMQQTLRKIIINVNPDLAPKLHKAFEASVKLDRLNELNQVLAHHVHNDCKNNLLFEGYLDKCITHGENAINYNQAKIEANAVLQESIAVTQEFKKQPTLAENQGIMPDNQGENNPEIWDVSILQSQESLKETEKERFMGFKLQLQDIKSTSCEHELQELRIPGLS